MTKTRLFVFLCRIDGKLSGLQTIAPDGTKSSCMEPMQNGSVRHWARVKDFFAKGLLTGNIVTRRTETHQNYKIRVCFELLAI